MLRHTICLALIVGSVGCNNATSMSDAGSGATGGGAATGGGTVTGGGSASGGGTGQDACVPFTCATAPVTCGVVADGCGHTLNCGACNCTAATFATDCPSRPCEVATGCSNNKCQYEPLTCPFERCTTCVGSPAVDGGAGGGAIDGGASCADTALRACGAGCAENFCDPSPTAMNGKIVYGNRCMQRAEVRCGLCDLAGLTCAADGGAASCQDITLAGVNPAFAECNGASPSATVLFVDPSSTAAKHTGAKDEPFLTLQEAMVAAGMRGSRAIIIGGAPTFTTGLTLANAVSVLGGYTGVPTWVRDPTRRPVIQVPASELANGRLVGVTATNITTPTELSNLDIVTENLASSPAGAGASNVGALLTNAPGLTLTNVHFIVGDAQVGAGGLNAAAPVPSVLAPSPAQNATQTNTTCPQSGLSPAQGGIGQAFSCNGVVDQNGRGGNGAVVQVVPNSSVGIVFSTGGTSAAGMLGGTASFVNSFIPGPGQNGTPFTARAADGSSPPASFSWVAGFPVPQGLGGAGTIGSAGRGGGGGGGGASSESPGTALCRRGAGGGAGGAGGCGGLPGSGGFPGGWSYGLVVTGGAPTLREVTAVVGAGGTGGTGGLGSAGLAGQSGGAGGTQALNPSLPAYAGSPGGNGGAGQSGGNGGNGASGLSRGIVCNAVRVDVTGFTANSRTSASTFAVAEGCN